MKRILQTFLKEQYDHGRLMFLGDIDEIIYYLDDIKAEELYKSDFHGLYHSQKVCFFAYLIGKHEGLSDEEMQILMDAARYHDIGRDSDKEDNLHGYVSAIKVDKFIKYDNPANMYYLKAIMDSHDHEDVNDVKTFSNWRFEKDEDDRRLGRKTEDLSFDKFIKLSDILKDADALDRLRFRNCPAVLDENYLRTDYSKKLINLSRLINDYYIKIDADEKYQILKEKYDKNSWDKKLCYHSVGFDFFKALGILQYGILSHYSAINQNISLSRNFNGNNGDFWISVVEAESDRGRNEAYDRYVKNGISFMCYASELVSGVNRVSDNGSYEPRISREYSDEKFVFGQIPIEDIQFISIPRHLINTDIRELQYLYCNSQYELVENNVNNFLNEIEVYCDIKIPRNKFESILEKFEEEQLRYNNYSRAEANEKSKEYFAKIDSMKDLLNSYIQEWMNIGFSELLGKTYDEKITLGEVMQYILNANGIQYDIVDEEIVNDNEGPFVDFPVYKDNDLFLLRLSTFDLNKNVPDEDWDIKIRD